MNLMNNSATKSIMILVVMFAFMISIVPPVVVAENPSVKVVRVEGININHPSDMSCSTFKILSVSYAPDGSLTGLKVASSSGVLAVEVPLAISNGQEVRYISPFQVMHYTNGNTWDTKYIWDLKFSLPIPYLGQNYTLYTTCNSYIAIKIVSNLPEGLEKVLSNIKYSLNPGDEYPAGSKSYQIRAGRHLQHNAETVTLTLEANYVPLGFCIDHIDLLYPDGTVAKTINGNCPFAEIQGDFLVLKAHRKQTISFPLTEEEFRKDAPPVFQAVVVWKQELPYFKMENSNYWNYVASATYTLAGDLKAVTLRIGDSGKNPVYISNGKDKVYLNPWNYAVRQISYHTIYLSHILPNIEGYYTISLENQVWSGFNPSIFRSDIVAGGLINKTYSSDGETPVLTYKVINPENGETLTSGKLRPGFYNSHITVKPPVPWRMVLIGTVEDPLSTKRCVKEVVLYQNGSLVRSVPVECQEGVISFELPISATDFSDAQPSKYSLGIYFRAREYSVLRIETADGVEVKVQAKELHEQSDGSYLVPVGWPVAISWNLIMPDLKTLDVYMVSNGNKEDIEWHSYSRKVSFIPRHTEEKLVIDVRPKHMIAYFTVGKYSFVVDGKTQKIDSPLFIDPKYGRLMVPLRALFEAIGYDVSWNSLTREVILTKKPGLDSWFSQYIAISLRGLRKQKRFILGRWSTIYTGTGIVYKKEFDQWKPYDLSKYGVPINYRGRIYVPVRWIQYLLSDYSWNGSRVRLLWVPEDRRVIVELDR